MLDVDAAASPLELPKVHNVGLEARNEVETSESPVLIALADEEYGGAPFDLNDRPITKLDRASDPGVKFQEGFPSPGHMVGHPYIEETPPMITVLATATDLSCSSVRMMQPSQSLFTTLIAGSPRTISPLNIFCRMGKFKCLNLACHFNEDSSALAPGQTS
jgi:hypothetical protein